MTIDRATSRVAAAVFSWVALSSAADVLADDYVSYTGRAVALHSQKFLYGERDLLVDRDGKASRRVVLYTCRNGAPFARKTVSYVDPLAPDFALEDASNGMREGIRSEGGGRAVFFRAAAADVEKRAALPHAPNLVADAGFDEFVRANWQPLTAKKGMKVNFLIPSRLNDMGFRVDEVRTDRLDGVPVKVFRLRVAGLVGDFVPSIDVTYGAEDRTLMRYLGVSDLRDASGNNLKVDVSFDPKDRRPSAESDVQSALRARLAPCT